MKYNCEYCNYSTDDFGNWSRHNRTKKHIKNSNKVVKRTYNDPSTIPQQSSKIPKRHG